MIAELRPKSQVTIPKPIIDRLGLSAGDKLEIFDDNGMICIMPVAVYPKGYVDKILADVENMKKEIEAGRQPVFDNVDELIADLDCDD